MGTGTNGQTKSGTPAQRMNIAMIRKFSKTPIPRRAINFIRAQICRLAWDLVPIEGETIKKKHLTQIKRLKRVLRNPNPDDSWDAWLGQLTEDMLCVGWGVSEIRPFAAGGEDHPFMLWPVDGASIEVDQEWDGNPNKHRYYQFIVNHRSVDKQYIPFLNNELMVMKYTPTTETPFGVAPMEVAFQTIQHLLDAMAFAGRTASNAQPKKLLWLKGLDQDQVNTIRAWWASSIAGGGEFPIMGAPDTDATTLELGMTTDNNLFLKWQEFLIAVIADAFGVDIAKMNLIVGINRSTGDVMDDSTDESVIAPLASTIEQYINKYILPLFGLSDEVVEFKFRFTTSFSDMKAISVINQVELQDDSATINEARARMGRGPLLHPKTGENIGDVTLSAYRAQFKTPAATVDGPEAALEEQRQIDADLAKQDAATANGDDFGTNSNNKNVDSSQRGGNGVASAKKPKPKAMNQRTDSATSME
jgi:Phage portal protein